MVSCATVAAGGTRGACFDGRPANAVDNSSWHTTLKTREFVILFTGRTLPTSSRNTHDWCEPSASVATIRQSDLEILRDLERGRCDLALMIEYVSAA